MMQCMIITKYNFEYALHDDDNMYPEYNDASHNEIKMHP